jgi:hypothetical protein
MSAESKITVYIRLLSGETLDIEIPPHTTSAHLYDLVFTSLPDTIRPNTKWQLTLLREETETAIVDEEIELSAEEKITLLIDPYEYKVKSDCFDARCATTNEGFLGFSLKVKNITNRYHYDYHEIVYRTSSGFVEDGDDVDSYSERCGKKWLDWEEIVRFPEDKPRFTADEWFERYLTRMKANMNLPVSSAIFVRMELERVFQWMKI